MKNLKRTRLVSIIVIAITASVLLSGISPVQAAGTRDMLLKAHLSSSTQVLTGSLDTAVIKLTAVPFGTSFNSFDVAVKADPAVLTATKMVLGSGLKSPALDVYCINGSGISCNPLVDGPGVAHLAAHSLLNGVNGTLFKVVYKALNGVGSFGTVGTTVVIFCFHLAEGSTQLAPTRFTVLSTTYGSIPASAIPTVVISANQTSITIKAAHSHNITITTVGVNGESSAVTLSAVGSPSGVVLVKFVSTTSPTVVSCNCGAKPALQLTITPLAVGTFTVTVSATIHGASTTIVSPVTINVTGN